MGKSSRLLSPFWNLASSWCDADVIDVKLAGGSEQANPENRLPRLQGHPDGLAQSKPVGRTPEGSDPGRAQFTSLSIIKRDRQHGDFLGISSLRDILGTDPGLQFDLADPSAIDCQSLEHVGCPARCLVLEVGEVPSLASVWIADSLYLPLVIPAGNK